jgi:hypothetical protein
MATIITGRDVTFTIDGDNYDAQATSATLTLELDKQSYQTLDGVAYKVIDQTGTFEIELLADWGATGSLCETLFTNIAADPNMGYTTVLTAASGASFTFIAQPMNFPQVSGSGNEAQTVSLTFMVFQGSVTPAFT